jgi:hypothetical protein
MKWYNSLLHAGEDRKKLLELTEDAERRKRRAVEIAERRRKTKNYFTTDSERLYVEAEYVAECVRRRLKRGVVASGWFDALSRRTYADIVHRTRDLAGREAALALRWELDERQRSLREARATVFEARGGAPDLTRGTQYEPGAYADHAARRAKVERARKIPKNRRCPACARFVSHAGSWVVKNVALCRGCSPGLEKRVVDQLPKGPFIVESGALRELRSSLGLSQEVLAHLCGWSRSYVRVLETRSSTGGPAADRLGRALLAWRERIEELYCRSMDKALPP